MRTMIVLPDHHHAEAKRKAARQGGSLSEYIRRLVASDLGKDNLTSDPREAGGPEADRVPFRFSATH